MRGYTLVELVFVLLLVGVATASAAPAARRQLDRAMVLGAREALVGLLAEARLAAVGSGGASVRVSATARTAEVLVGGVRRRSVLLGTDFGVTLTLSGSATEAELSYDALGLGRVASQTIGFRRGDQVAELVVSAYGRVRRR
jgi:prepilin-type N-terminal cleavage/methylation domain-containing protein